MRIVPLGDKAIQIQFHNEISPETNEEVRGFFYYLKKFKIPGVTEIVPTYRSVTLYYEPTMISFDELTEKISSVKQILADQQLPPPRVIHIPTCYGGEFGPDLQYVAALNKLSEEW